MTTLAEAWPLCRALDAAANHATGRTERALTATVVATCQNGHPLVGDNVYVTPSTGKRRCRLCNTLAAKAWRHRPAAPVVRVGDDFDPRRERAALAAYPDVDPTDAYGERVS